ncbi:hypothetical protein [Paraliomyxa miuraensis]|uniref:hypothetical protein n=1 Tax=Paraliomyxa miuraensis TaxID=376150 RepID=UPI0022524E0F|nr:hypothetical protein [Paraliomyxa miuraensis]MCX4241197.1 hypothetical protein [Paraliomyxa miuraensis]
MPRRVPSFSLLLSLSLLAPACNEDVTIEAKVIRASSKEYEIEVKSKPGIEIDVGGQEATTDDQGVARVVVSVERLSYMSTTTDLHVMAIGGNFLFNYFGETTVELPFSPADAAKVGDATHWVKIGSGPRASSGGALWSFGEDGGALMNDDGSVTIALQGPGKATVELLERKADLSEDGRGAIEFTPEETLAMVPSDALMGYGSAPETPITAKVTLADGSAKDVPLTAQWMSVSGDGLRARLTAVPQQPFPGERNAEPLVVHLDGEGHLRGGGRKGPLSTMDIVSIGAPKEPRKLSDCDGYKVVTDGVESTGTFSLPREGIDEEVVAWDAHTGKELGRKVFPAQDYCPFSATSDQSVLKVRPDGDDIVAWLMTL